MSPDAIIRTARRSSRLTQTQLGARLGMSQASIARLERPGANPTLQTLENVVRAAGHQLELAISPQASSVDDTLIASYLRMSPAERLRHFQSSHDSVAALRRLALGGSDAGAA